MNVVFAELEKLKRYGMVKAGFLVTILAALYAFAPALARAMDWFSPFPPGNTSSFFEEIVSPGPTM